MKTYTCTSGIHKTQKKWKHWADWINTMDWNYYCTFTTRYPLSLKSARRLMERFYSFIKKSNNKVKLFWVAEPFDLNVGYHLHALIDISDSNSDITPNHFLTIKNVWQLLSKGGKGKENNYTVIKPYNKKLGGNYYVAKYMMQRDADYDLHF